MWQHQQSVHPFNEDECFPINLTHCSMTSSFPMPQPCDFQLSSRWRTGFHSAFTFSPPQFVRTTSLLWFIWRTSTPSGVFFTGFFSFISTYQPSFHRFLFLLLVKWRADMRLCPFFCKVTCEGGGCYCGDWCFASKCPKYFKLRIALQKCDWAK